MNTTIKNASLAAALVGLVACGHAAADSVFAYNKATLSITAVPATVRNNSRTQLEDTALKQIRASRTDVRAGRVVIVWADSSTIVNAGSIRTGFVALAAGQAPIRPVSHAGSYWTDARTGATRFLRGNSEGRIIQFAQNTLNAEQGGYLHKAVFAHCWDNGIQAR